MPELERIYHWDHNLLAVQGHHLLVDNPFEVAHNLSTQRKKRKKPLTEIANVARLEKETVAGGLYFFRYLPQSLGEEPAI
jgi:hypothetical protein